MKINKRKFIKRIIFLIVFISLIIYGIFLYKKPAEREKWISLYQSVVAKFNKDEIKNVEEIFTIQYDPAVQTTILGRKDGILIIDKTGIREHTTATTPIWKKELNLTNPIVAEKSGRLGIAELSGKKVMAYDMRELVWEAEIGGNIQKICINKEGYVGVLFTQVGYKSGFVLFTPEGKELYTKLFANTMVLDADIGNDRTVAMVEADTTGANIDSVISYLSEKGEVIYSSLEKGAFLTGIGIIDGNIIAVGENKIIKVNKNKVKSILDDFENKDVSGINIETDKIVKIYRSADALFADKSNIEITDVNNKKKGNGEVSGTVKAVEVEGKTIAVILNERIDFFDIGGKYLNTMLIPGDYKNMKLFSDGNYACIQSMDKITVVRIR